MENKNQLPEIEINHSTEKTAVLISPKMTGKLALVDLKTLKRITSMLSLASFNQIKSELIHAVEDTTNLEQYAEVLKDEINFQESVNLIREVEL